MWKDEFVELLFSNDPTKIDAEKAAKLKYANFPTFLYQYRTFDKNGNSLKALKEDKIFLSNPLEFNDPYDCAFKIKENFYINEGIMKKVLEDDPAGFRKAHEITRIQLLKLQKSDNIIRDLSRYISKNRKLEFKNDPKKLREISKEVEVEIRGISADFDELRKYLLVSCFSEDYKSILMWSHYAKDHTGFCVQYDFQSFGYDCHLTRNLFPILYTNKIFTIDDYVHNTQPQFQDVLSNYLNGIVLNKIIDGTQLELLEGNKKTNNMFPILAALNKYEGWKYEKEWRYVLYHQNELESAYINVPKPISIYLGANSDDNDAILEVAQNKNIDVYQMQMKSSKYALEAKKIS